jgi:N5-(cytidine 5'-diphosphoramidyl)-L-glutamine hydrolase
MKLVLVSQRVDYHGDRGEQRDSLDQKLIEFLVTGGYLPVPVPNCLSAEGVPKESLDQWIQAIGPAAIILSGGNDIGDCPIRDRTESVLLSVAERDSLPVLGICRGMQMMGVQAGAKLIKVDAHVRTRHVLAGEISREVNSFHGMALDSCPPGYQVIAQSADGGIEAIRHRHLRWEGWMWHPEREKTFHSEDLSRLRRVIG